MRLSRLLPAALLALSCDDVTPFSLELVIPENGDPFADLNELVFGVTDGTTTAQKTFPPDENRLELPLVPFGDGWVFTLEGRQGGAPRSFGQTVPLSFQSGVVPEAKLFFAQVNAFHQPPSQPTGDYQPFFFFGLPPLPVGACLMPGGQALLVGDDCYDPAALSFTPMEESLTRFGATCTPLPDGAILLGGFLDGAAQNPSLEAQLLQTTEQIPSQRLQIPNLARVGHQTSAFTVPVDQVLSLPDGTQIEGGSTVVIVTGGVLQQEVQDLAEVLIQLPTGTLIHWEPLTPEKSLRTSARAAHTATLVQSEGKLKLLLAGGIDPLLKKTSSTELIDLETFAIESGPSLVEPRAGQTATVTRSGEVIFIGGLNQDNEAIASAERFNPRFGVIAKETDMLFSRVGHTATLLQNGLIMVAGGLGRRLSQAEEEHPLKTGELLNPEDTTGVGFLGTRDLVTARVGHTALLMRDGTVLLVGGAAAGSPQAELYVELPE